MKFLNNLFFLLLFLYGNSCFSSVLPNVEIPPLEELTEDAHNFSETSVGAYDGILSVPSVNSKNSLCSPGFSGSFEFASSFEEQMAINYFPYSRRISPGLDISAIIFPFHIFL